MKRDLQKQDDRRVAEQASDWVSRLEATGPEEHEAFAKWLTESRRNVEEFLFASAVEKALESADPQGQFDVKQLLNEAKRNVVALEMPSALSKMGEQTPSPSERLPHPPIAPGRSRQRLLTRIRWAAALSAIAIVLTTLAWQRPDLFSGWERYTTSVGEQRTLRLLDGSLVQLNTHSHLEVHLAPQARELRLIKGEALFQVQRDPDRPFRVQAGSAVVQAIGTQFNIYRHGESATVAVIEGAVGIVRRSPENRRAIAEPGFGSSRDDTGEASLKLVAGQEASIAASGRIAKREAADVQRAVAWRQRRLVFDKDTLAHIAEEFNRYNRAPRIRIEGESVRVKRYTGIFDADDPNSLIEYLARDESLALERRDEEFWIRPSS